MLMSVKPTHLTQLGYWGRRLVSSLFRVMNPAGMLHLLSCGTSYPFSSSYKTLCGPFPFVHSMTVAYSGAEHGSGVG
jgi:hypothetical protein